MTPATAHAGGRGGAGTDGAEQTGGAADGKISAGVVFDRSKNGTGTTSGPVTPVSDWTPPACYYAPRYSPDQLQKYLEPIWAVDSTGAQWDLEQRNRYVNGKPYKDFNKSKAGKGHWWDSFIPDGREGDPRAFDCDKPYFWVDKGDPPPADVPEAVTPERLAQLAYAEIRIPGTAIALAPQAESKVNLPTWAWLDKAAFKPVSVTASVPAIGIEATTTAEPVSLKLEPGTPDATLHPASGECPITGGRIGEPYAKGKAHRTPPCGLTYLRASGDKPYSLQATITWKIHWTGTGGAGGDLPDGAFGAVQDITVQEIQAINR
ncbi:hypothetical protein OG897_26315 [Streptomyces sp. NBC_00237]|uniref:hypothetical protein n=1 Tax=Streptomyces sp. NBC_00237 TaxID=2975687 RepID=UPI002252B898|nr:hypothetical protein [Streptomyces sp. NBC_00237]MCX5204957.1 hypothetical protein [Streptomyces sp. NBC_00237]